jgi:hypothetical protein
MLMRRSSRREPPCTAPAGGEHAEHDRGERKSDKNSALHTNSSRAEARERTPDSTSRQKQSSRALDRCPDWTSPTTCRTSVSSKASEACDRYDSVEEALFNVAAHQIT